jgi:VanZ family protein
MIKKNIFSFLIALVILFLSFTGQETFSKLNIPRIPHLDKMVHSGMYFVFTLTLIFENRSFLINIKNYVILAIIPVFFGTLIEVLQPLLTTSRTGDFFDACFNTIGVILAIIVWGIFNKIRHSEVK